MNDLRAALIGYADWLGYGHAERADAWLARLNINAPELEQFRAAKTPSCPAYHAAPTQPDAAAGRSSGSRPAADAADALERARHDRWHAINWLPAALANSLPNSLPNSLSNALPTSGPGFLAGVPVAIKDLMAVAGAPLTGGSAAVEGLPAGRDATVVARLKQAGAVIVATSNLHELAYGITSDNPNFGRVVNPVAPGHMPGGSSGGSAAAIAAGIVRCAVGTDTAGSIRIPAACCGVVGFKPSFDAVPREGVMDLAPSLDHVGPLGRSVDDCAALFAAMLALPEVPAWTLPDLSGLSIARLTGYFAEPLAPAVRAALATAVTALAAGGAKTLELAVEGIAAAAAIQFKTICAEATEVHGERLRSRGQQLGEDVRVRLEIGHFLPGHWYLKAQRMRSQLAGNFDLLFRQADLLICPTLRTPAPLVGATQVDIDGRLYPLHTAVTQLTMPFNLTGLPAISVPWRNSPEGLPIGLQIIGKRGADWLVLAAARRLEAVRGRDD